TEWPCRMTSASPKFGFPQTLRRARHSLARNRGEWQRRYPISRSEMTTMQAFTMNQDLYKYCLGKRKRPGTETGKAIDRLVSLALDCQDADDRALLQAIASVLSNAPILDEDAFRFLRPLHGCGGSEGYVLDVERPVEAAFWKSLSERFAKHQGLIYIAADA